MHIQWVADLKYHTQEMQRLALIFSQEYPLSKPKQMQGFIHNIDVFEAWVSTLPDAHEMAVWQWIDWKVASHDMHTPLIMIQGYFEILFMFNTQVTSFETLSPCAQTLWQEIDFINHLFHESRETHEGFRCTEASETHGISPYIILSVLWQSYYQYLDRTLTPQSFKMHDWPLVMYHPLHTAYMIRHAVLSMVLNREDILLVPRKNESYFEICITQPRLLMTPLLWERFISEFRPPDAIERLRELGGSLEPLTWDEGYGQGIIVRLPWTPS